jgi:uncharacterized protein (DUF2141 family)
VTTSALPVGQIGADIGSPRIAGSTTHVSGQYTILAAGSDIWNASDEFRYVYQQVAGDMEITARVASITRADQWSKAGVMIRESLSPQSAHAMVVTSAAKGYAFQRRPEAGGLSVHTSGGSGAPPGWVRLVRAGSVFTAYRSANGTSWTKIGSDTIPMGTTVFAGIAVTSHNAYQATTAVVDSLRITEAVGPMNRAPLVTILSPAANASFTAPGAFGFAAHASDADGTIVGVDFYANGSALGRDVSAPYALTASGLAAGTYALTAVATDNHGLQTASEPVSITVTPAAANRAPVVTVSAAAASGTALTAPATVALVATASDPDGTIVSVDFFSNDTLLVRDATAPYSHTMTGVAAGSYAISAVATDDKGAKTTATTSLTVASAANRPPVVTVAVASGSGTLTAPATVSLTATASDPDGTVAAVDFYSNGTLLGRDTTAPYSYAATGLAAGTYAITAAATDDKGSKTTSAPATITVSPAANLPPLVTLTSPAPGTSLLAPASFAMSVSASDPDGSIASVDYYANGVLVGRATAAPFSATATGLQAGTYVVTAIATDNSGSRTTSSPATLTVVAPVASAPTAVAFTVSADHNSLVQSYALEIFRTGVDPQTASPVATMNLGKPSPGANGEVTVGCATFFQGLASGTYIATVKAIGDAGAARSELVTFTR